MCSNVFNAEKVEFYIVMERLEIVLEVCGNINPEKIMKRSLLALVYYNENTSKFC